MDRHRISESQRQFLLDGVQQGLRGRALCDSFGESYRRILTGIGSKARWTKAGFDSDHEEDRDCVEASWCSSLLRWCPPKSGNLETLRDYQNSGGSFHVQC